MMMKHKKQSLGEGRSYPQNRGWQHIRYILSQPICITKIYKYSNYIVRLNVIAYVVSPEKNHGKGQQLFWVESSYDIDDGTER